MSRSSQETVRASTSQAFGSGTEDPNLVSLQLYLNYLSLSGQFLRNHIHAAWDVPGH